jgi:hypothetical protein
MDIDYARGWVAYWESLLESLATFPRATVKTERRLATTAIARSLEHVTDE